MSGCLAIILTYRMGTSIDDTITSAGVPGVATSPPIISNRKVNEVDLLNSSVRRHKSTSIQNFTPDPEPSVSDFIEAQITQSGAQVAANAVRDNLAIPPTTRRAHIEEVARQWAERSPNEAADWIEKQLERAESGKDFKQAAISGYIESIALRDPEAAAEAANLLDATVSENPKAGATQAAVIVSGDPGFPGDADFLTRNRK